MNLSCIYKKINHLIRVCFLLFLGVGSITTAYSQTPLVNKGVLNLQNFNFEKAGIVPISGEWEFAQNKEFSQFSADDSISFIQVPSALKGESYNEHGFSVYRVKVLLPTNYSELSIKLGGQSTAYNLYLNGALKHSVGTFGKTESESQPAYEIVNVNVPDGLESLELAIEISNFHYCKAGLWEKIYIGKQADISAHNTRLLIFDVFLIAAFIVLFVYHFILYFLINENGFKKSKTLLFFAILCFIALIRTAVTGQMFVLIMMPTFPWEIMVKLEFISFFLMIGVGLQYFKAFFSSFFSNKVTTISSWFSISVAVVSFFVPIDISSRFIFPMEIFALLTIMYLLFGLVAVIKKKEESAALALIALIFFAIAGVNDVFYSQDIIKTFYLAPTGIFFFFVIHAISLSKLVTNSHSEISKLNRKFKELNYKLETKFQLKTEELKSTNEELVLLSTVADKTENAVLIIDSNGFIEWVNNGFTKIYGYSLEEFKELGSTIFDIASNTDVIDYINRAISSKQSTNYVIKLKNKYNKDIWVQTTWSPVFNDDGTVRKLIAIDTEITEIKAEQEKVKEKSKLIVDQKNEIELKQVELEKSISNLKQLNKIFLKITENHDVNSIINSVYENINELMDASGFGIGIYNEQEHSIEFSNYIEKNIVLPFDTVSLTEVNSPTVWCFLNEKEIFVRDHPNDTKKYISEITFTNHGDIPKSIIYIPLVANKKKIGVITVQSFNKHAFSNYHFDLLKNISIYTAIALENAEAFRQIENLSLVASKTSNYVIIINKFDKIEWVNKGFTNVTGYKFDEVVGQLTRDIIGGEETELDVIEEINDAIFRRKVSYKGHVTNYKKDGTPFKAAIDLSPILDKNGNFIKYFVIGRDISERAKYQAELQKQRDIAVEQRTKIEQVVKQLEESEHIIREKNHELTKLSHVVSTTDNAVMIISPIGEVKWVNHGFTKLYGFTLEEFVAKGKNIVNAATNPTVIPLINAAIENKSSTNYDSKLLTKFGEDIWVNTTWTPIFDDNGELIELIAIDADISKQKIAEEKLLQQNNEISEQHKHITDSILYAQRIQQALLSPLELVQNIIDKLGKTKDFNLDYFVLYKPKDVVSGDFYWTNYQTDDLYFAAADCTGHGVPGAFMSVLGISFLNEIINNKNCVEPNAILNKLRKKLIKTLRQKDINSDTKDGMDISLCRINLKKMELEYSGAYQPLYIVRNATGEPVLTKISGDRMPIGVHTNSKTSFTKTTISIQNNDTFYFGSDGYISQFGGEKDKTFKSKRLEKLLLKINNLPLHQQKYQLDTQLMNWQQDKEQVDDILIVGVKMNLLKG